MAKRLSRSYSELSFSGIKENHMRSKEAINIFYSKKNAQFDNFFANYTKEEINIEQKKKLDELDKMFSLSILSSIEACFKIDYSIRCEKRYKDLLSKQFRNIYKKYGLKIPFEDKILKTWRDNTSERNIFFNELIQIYKYRHWLAHGRYWVLKTNTNKYDFNYLAYISAIVEDLLLIK